MTDGKRTVIRLLLAAKDEAIAIGDYEMAATIRDFAGKLIPPCPTCGHKHPPGEVPPAWTVLPLTTATEETPSIPKATT